MSRRIDLAARMRTVEEEMFRSTRRRTRGGISGWTVALALAAVLAGCSSGGDEENFSATPCSSMVFAGSDSSPASGDVFLREASSIYSTCTTIDVQVVINDLNGIWTVGFDLTFPSTLVHYTGYSMGPLLQQGTLANPLLVSVSESSGSLSVAASRAGSDPPVNAVGSQVLMTLHFGRLSTGAAMIDFNQSGGSPVNEVIQDDLGNVRPAIFGPGHGGLLTVPL